MTDTTSTADSKNKNKTTKPSVPHIYVLYTLSGREQEVIQLLYFYHVIERPRVPRTFFDQGPTSSSQGLTSSQSGECEAATTFSKYHISPDEDRMFVPRRKTFKIIHGKRELQEMRLYPGYIFLYTKRPYAFMQRLSNSHLRSETGKMVSALRNRDDEFSTFRLSKLYSDRVAAGIDPKLLWANHNVADGAEQDGAQIDERLQGDSQSYDINKNLVTEENVKGLPLDKKSTLENLRDELERVFEGALLRITNEEELQLLTLCGLKKSEDGSLDPIGMVPIEPEIYEKVVRLGVDKSYFSFDSNGNAYFIREGGAGGAGSAGSAGGVNDVPATDGLTESGNSVTYAGENYPEDAGYDPEFVMNMSHAIKIVDSKILSDAGAPKFKELVILDGPLKGMEGSIVGTNRRRRSAKFRTNFMGVETEINVPLDIIQVVAE